MIDFFHKFHVFLPAKNGEKKVVSKETLSFTNVEEADFTETFYEAKPYLSQNVKKRTLFRYLIFYLSLSFTLSLPYLSQDVEEAVRLANEALKLSRDNYESYWARAQANREAGWVINS